jgi:hypothetical protein
MINLIVVSLILAAVACIAGLLCACWVRAHDGSVTSTSQLAEDIREDT